MNAFMIATSKYQSSLTLLSLRRTLRTFSTDIVAPPTAAKPSYRTINPHPLSKYISTCLTSSTVQFPGNRTFTISFLGTSSGNPTKQRLTSCTLVRIGPCGYVMDVGEGIQRQMQFTPLNAGCVTTIVITHMHADHVLGLPGLLLGMSLIQKAKGIRRRLDIYGPPGLYDYIGITLNITHSGIEKLDIVVHELMGGTAVPGQPGKSRIYRTELKRNTIFPQKDGTWILQNNKTDPILKAAEVSHMKGIQTFGYTIQEHAAERSIDKDKAVALGLKPGVKYAQIKKGTSVWNDDNTHLITPEEVLAGLPRKARKFTLVGDNFAWSAAMHRLGHESDVLVHEATLTTEQMEAGEAVMRGHSSAEMAGAVANLVKAKCLVLHHISPKMKNKPDILEMRNRAKEASEGTAHVVVAHDFLELLIPPYGFEDRNDDGTTRNDEAEE